MNKKIFVPIAVIGFVALILTLTGCSNNVTDTSSANDSGTVAITNENIEEFTMTSFTNIIDGKYFPEYSLKEIKVKKGDLVKIKITVTKGNHDFKIDELNIYAVTPLDKEVTVEFVADKVGEFIYYCAKPGHRENGHWGTLIVTE